RFSLIVLYVIFTKSSYNNPRQQKYPTVMCNRMKTIPITILFAFITILLGCSKESKTIKEDDEKILINAKEILENKNLAGLITKLENTELTEETDINKIPKVILN